MARTKRVKATDWELVIADWLSGMKTFEVCEKHKIKKATLFHNLKKRNISRESIMGKKQVGSIAKHTEMFVKTLEKAKQENQRTGDMQQAVDLLPKDTLENMREGIFNTDDERELKKRKQMLANEVKDIVDNIPSQSGGLLGNTFLGNAKKSLNVYDEVLDILRSKNPILAKNISALVAKVMVRANEMLDKSDMTSRELKDVTDSLEKINNIMQIIPKTQPMIAQQINIDTKEKQTKDFMEKQNIKVNVEFI